MSQADPGALLSTPMPTGSVVMRLFGLDSSLFPTVRGFPLPADGGPGHVTGFGQEHVNRSDSRPVPAQALELPRVSGSLCALCHEALPQK